MASFPKLLHSKTRYVLGITALLFSAMACVAFSLKGDDNFELARQQVTLRKIGHEVLRYLGDSSSRVLPVVKVAENTYQIRFENEFAFKTDSLVKIIEHSLADADLTSRHLVNVRNRSDLDVVFAYMIAGGKTHDQPNRKDIVPCIGRTQPLGSYIIEVSFEQEGLSDVQKGYLLGSLPMLALIGLLFSRPAKRQTPVEKTEELNDGRLQIGNTVFDSEKRLIIFAGKKTELTVKENKVLLILGGSLNAAVERARLQKEIWEDEGVIVGRSLDVFVSKLRKKLEADTSVQLVNIHGKGYKLEIKHLIS